MNTRNILIAAVILMTAVQAGCEHQEGPLEDGDGKKIAGGKSGGASTGGTTTGGTTTGGTTEILPGGGTPGGTTTGGTTTGGTTTGGTTTGGTTTGGGGAPVCGNGAVETGETCDDGNTAKGDGCSSTCTLETPVYSIAYLAIDKLTLVSDLYLATVVGSKIEGSPKKLTNNSNTNFNYSFPSFSPDGKKLLYTKGDKMTKKSTLQVIPDIAAAVPAETAVGAIESIATGWHPNGQDVLFTASGCALMRKAKLDGSAVSDEGKTLIDPPPADPANPTPDEKKNTYYYFDFFFSPVKTPSDASYERIVFTFFKSGQQSDLFVKKFGDPDPAKFLNLTNTPNVNEMSPAISPDGQSLLYSFQPVGDDSAKNHVRRCKLKFTEPIACTDEKTLTNDPSVPDPGHNNNPCWSWDGKKVFFSSNRGGAPEMNDIYMMDADGKNLVNLTNTPMVNEPYLSCSPAPKGAAP